MPTLYYCFNSLRRAVRDDYSALTTHRRKCVSLLRSAMLCVRHSGQTPDQLMSSIRLCDMPVPERMAVHAARMICPEFDSLVFDGGEEAANDPAIYEQAIVVIAAFVTRHSFSHFADTTALGRRWHVLQHLALRAQRTNSPLPLMFDRAVMHLAGFDGRPNYRDSEDFGGYEDGGRSRDECWWTLTCSTRVMLNYANFTVGLGLDGEVTIVWSDGEPGRSRLVGTFNVFDVDFPGRSVPADASQQVQDDDRLLKHVRSLLCSMLSSSENFDRVVFRSLRRFADSHHGRSWFGTWLRTPAARRCGMPATAFRAVMRLSSYTRDMRLTEAARLCPPMPRGWLRSDIAAAGSTHPSHDSNASQMPAARTAPAQRQQRTWDWNNIPDEVRRIMEADLALHLEEPTTEGA